MKDVIKKELLNDINQTIEILNKREDKDIEELKELSGHSIEDVALHKDLDLVSVSVLIYSLYKIVHSMPEKDYQDLVKELQNARKYLQNNGFGRYNKSIKTLFKIVKKSDAKVKQHLDDVMTAARIKKSSELLKKGLSIGQAAGIMGLTNWDLQDYVGKTNFLDIKQGDVSVNKRLTNAFNLFGVGL
jgi:hypothetical protein